MNTLTRFPRRSGLIVTAVLGILASSLSAVCAAADSTDAPTIIVKYGDLNLSTPQGAAALYGRIRSAAETVCRHFDQRGVASQARKATCINHAISAAVTEVNEGSLFTVYNEKNKTPMPTTLLSQSR